MNTSRNAVIGILAPFLLAATALASETPPQKITEGALRAMGPEGKPLGDCPLKRTAVKVEISGFVARVEVTQQFVNPFKDKIEAVYVFPLGAKAAVDDMTMKVGDRVIRGQIKPREEARQIYEQAKASGHVASLLDQERPNIFTQSVANIEPGKEIVITIRYSEMLKYEDAKFSFVFPMVVGPRYIPGQAVGQSGTGWAPDTTRVPDASRITPPVTPKGTRAGHDISIQVALRAGLAIKALGSPQHKILTRYLDDAKTSASVELANEVEIPNKDFVLEYSTASDEITDAVLTHTDTRGGYFTLVLQPPRKVKPAQIVPREIIFVIDTSGSQQGFPVEISKKLITKAINNLRPKDTFNLITFSGSTSILWDKPRENTEENRTLALEFVKTLQGGGGTEMMKAINAALGGDHEKDKVRIVAFFTDGYVGNDMEILDAVRKNAGVSRVFSFGIGTSVNRYLLDGMAQFGRGEVEYVLNQTLAEPAAEKFYDRIDAPVLTDIAVDFGDLADAVEAKEVYPRMVPDLFSVQAVVVKGRYKTGQNDRAGTIVLHGMTSQGPFQRRISVMLPADAKDNEVLPAQWARAKVEELMSQDLLGAQQGKPDPAIKETILGLGLNYRLLTQYTSFVAVEEKTVTIGGQPRTVAVPVEMPEGVSYEGVFGEGEMSNGKRSKLGWGLVGDMPSSLSAGSGVSYSRAAPVVVPAPASQPTVSLDALGGVVKAESVKTQVQQIKADSKLSQADKKAKVAELKLAKALQGLEGKLDAKGDYTAGGVIVRAGKIDVSVYLHELNDKALAELKKLGFSVSLEAKAVNMVIGSIDVKLLADLAWLDEVRRIEPPQVVPQK
jgi:Ca-activated chloride channel family protein